MLPPDKHPGAPHLSELAGALTASFGGTMALAETLHALVSDPKTPDWLKTRAYTIVVNTIAGASKLEHAENIDHSMINDDDLNYEATLLMRQTLGIDEATEKDLAAVIGAWPRLPASTRANIVAMTKVV